MTSFKYLIYHNESRCIKENQLHGQPSDVEKRHEYDAMQQALEFFYSGVFPLHPKYSGEKVKVSEAAPSNDGVIVTLETESSEGAVYQSLLQFIESLKKIQGRPHSLCLVIEKLDGK